MTAYGADVQQLDRLAQVFAKVGDDTNDTMRRVREGLANVPWTGPDASRFRSQWTADAARLAVASDTLRRLAASLRNQAEEQRRISQLGPQTAVTSLVPGGTTGSNGSQFVSTAGMEGLDRRQFGSMQGSPDGPLESWSPRAPFPAEMYRLLAGESSLSDLKSSAASALSSLDLGVSSDNSSFKHTTGWSLDRAGDASWGHYDLRAAAQVGVEGHLGAFSGIQDGHLRAGFDAGIKLGAYGELSAATQMGGFVPVGIHAEALAGAEGDVAGAMMLGPDGARASLGAEGFAGARIAGEGSVGIGHYGDASAGGEAWAGVGAKFSADADVGWDRIELGFDTGFAFGIGGKVSFDFGFSPKGIFHELPGFSRLSSLDLTDLGWDDVGSLVAGSGYARDAAEEAFSGAARVVESAGSAAKSAVTKVGSKLNPGNWW